jgi:4-carboxymuconolactone decarboxylase
MSTRFRKLDASQLSPEQRVVFDAIAAPRGGVVPAPFHILLESPELASLTTLGPRLSELLVLITATHWGAEYEFSVHAPEARKAGVADTVIAALQAGETPRFGDADSQLLYEFATSFFETRDVPDGLFDKAVAQFGRRRVVELAGVLGYYSGLAMLLRIFRVPAEKP